MSLSARSLAEPAAASIAELESVRRDRGAGADRFRLDVERFYIRAGELVAVVGPSGSGKSTFLDLLALSLAPSSAGCFRMGPDGADVAAFWRERDGGSLAKLRREMIGYVLQSGALLPFLTAAGNIELPLRLMGRMGAEEQEQVDGLVTRLRLNAFARRLPAELSIGQRQRVAVARALVHRPILILADEPTASLDPASAGAVMALLTELAREQGSAVLMVTHDERLAARHGFSPVRCRPVAAAAGGSRSIVRRDA